MDFGMRKAAPQGATTGASATEPVIKDATTQTFAKDVLEASRNALVLADFWADWCGPCKQLTPLLEKVVKSYGGKVRLVKINTDQNPAIASQLRIQSLPTVYAFRDGRPLDGFMGAIPESEIKAFIGRLIGGEEPGPDLQAAVAEADKSLAAGDLAGAAEIYAAVLQEEPGNVGALAGLASTYMKSGDTERAEQTLALVPPDKKDSGPVAAVRASLELARKGKTAGDVVSLLARVEADPKNHQARIDLALALAARGDKPGAVAQLLESVRRDRNWNEQAARKQLVELFEAWGPKDPATIEGRKRLSSILFS